MKRSLIIALAAAFLPAAASATTVNLVTNGSFEMDPGVVSQGVNGHGAGSTFGDMPTTGSSWGIWTSGITGWTSGRNGIEIQSSRTLNPDQVADDGSYYVELDTRRNSEMWQSVDLGVGSHVLRFAYAPRVAQTGSNQIGFSIGDATGSLLDGLVSDSYTGGPRGWTEYVFSFEVATAGSYMLSFDARGNSNSLGGLLDDVAINAVPLPAGMLLLGTALGGLGLARRRKKA